MLEASTLTVGRPLPIYPNKQTFSVSVGMSQTCHEPKYRSSNSLSAAINSAGEIVRPRVCLRGRGLLFSGFAGFSLGSGGSQRARGSCGPRRTCRSGRSGKAAVFYHHLSLILPGGNFDYASGGELRSNPTKPSSRTALDLHCFVWANFNMHARLARAPNSSYDR